MHLLLNTLKTWEMGKKDEAEQRRQRYEVPSA